MSKKDTERPQPGVKGMIAVIAYINFFDNDLRQVVVDVGPEDTWKDSLKKAIDMGLYGTDEYADEHKTFIDSLPMNFEEARGQMVEGEHLVTFALLYGDAVVL